MKKGFTLVELLAVIVILAVILVIAVPKITDVIDSTKKSSLEASFKLILDSAEKEYTTREMLGTLDQTNDPIECSDVTDLSEDYECDITFNNGVPSLTLTGKNKFEGLKCTGTKGNGECKEVVPTAVEILKSTLGKTGGMYQDDTADKNYRYKGANPDNYVLFNEELWRIIGIFKVSNGTKEEERVKIVRELMTDKNNPSTILKYSWDSSDSGTNSGYGVNDWNQADLKKVLDYYGGYSTTCNYCTTSGQATCPETNDCSNIIDKLSSIALGMIEDTVWNLGGSSSNSISPSTFYSNERGTNVYTGRPTISTAKVGLIYPSDYGYSGDNYTTDCTTLNLATCKTNNWLGTATSYWTMSPYSSSAYIAFNVSVGGNAYYNNAFCANALRPSVYLKSNILITSGTGTSGDPYQLNTA